MGGDGITRRLSILVAIAIASGCMRTARPETSPQANVAEEKSAQAECTRLIADTVKLRSIVSDSGRRDSLNALCRKRYLNVRVF